MTITQSWPADSLIKPISDNEMLAWLNPGQAWPGCDVLYCSGPAKFSLFSKSAGIAGWLCSDHAYYLRQKGIPEEQT